MINKETPENPVLFSHQHVVFSESPKNTLPSAFPKETLMWVKLQAKPNRLHSRQARQYSK